MDDDLNEQLAALKAAATPDGLEGLEQRVWSRLQGERLARAVQPAILALRAAAVGGALALGAAAGGATAVAAAGETQEVSVFSVRSQLAPSTLLDHHS